MTNIGFNILKPKEWICIIAGLSLTVVIYMVTIHPSLQLFADLEKARLEKKKACDELAQTQAHEQQLLKQISQNRKTLAQIGGSPPMEHEKDALIAQLTDLANKCQIVIDRYSPLDTIEKSNHRAYFVQFTGHGGFNSFKQYFKLVENQIDFVDVTHFSITADQNKESAACQMTWSCRINCMRTDNLDLQNLVLKSTINDLVTTEVALHEP
ncbi:MAG: type 4a pilus biogenesis protein PilO [Planctomycetota bacterium]|nr:MAG: type 4a pilus biogenesis protein PilO [Planctomycetota bacterium]